MRGKAHAVCRLDYNRRSNEALIAGRNVPVECRSACMEGTLARGEAVYRRDD